MSAPDLLPCPFCGEAPVVVEVDEYPHTCWYATCNSQSCKVSPDAKRDTEQEAIAATKAQRVLRMRADLAAFDGDRRGILDALRKSEEDLLETVLAATPSTAGTEPIVPANAGKVHNDYLLGPFAKSAQEGKPS